MRIVHRISLNVTSAIRGELAKFDIEVGDGFSSFDIDESDANWLTVKRLTESWNAVDVPETKFTRRELDSAAWLRVVPGWHSGYPQPNDGDFGYLKATYDLSDYCAECGTGLRQKAPFRLEAEPKWKNRTFLQLNWVFDEFFVQPETWEQCFEPFFVKSSSVLGKSGSKRLETIVQLDLDISETRLDLSGQQLRECSSCGRSKVAPITRGTFCGFANEPVGKHAVKSQEWFGDGHSAHRAVIISGALYASLNRNDKIRGASFTPLASGGSPRS